MNKCTFCGREANCDTKFINGYEILDNCTDCEEELMDQECNHDNFETIPISGTDETYTICHDCGKEI